MNLVIKMGGAEGLAEHTAALVNDVRTLIGRGHQVTLVHGGSDAATQLGEALGKPARFATSPSGHTSRLTDADTLEVFAMATASINRRLVSALQAAGVQALGLSGLDGRLLEAAPKGPFRVVENGRMRVVRGDLTGSPLRANGELLRMLSDAGYVPVIAPLAIAAPEMGASAGQALNVDGDRAAAMIARALGADALVILTAVPGVLANFPDASSLIREVAFEELGALQELAGGRMKKKVLAAEEALAPRDGAGAPPACVVIAAANVNEPVQNALAGSGTVIAGAVRSAVNGSEFKGASDSTTPDPTATPHLATV